MIDNYLLNNNGFSNASQVLYYSEYIQCYNNPTYTFTSDGWYIVSLSIKGTTMYSIGFSTTSTKYMTLYSASPANGVTKSFLIYAKNGDTVTNAVTGGGVSFAYKVIVKLQ